MFRFINFLLLAATIGIFLAFFQSDKITQEVLELFPKTKDKDIIEIYQKFSNSRNILVAIKGFDSENRDKLNDFLNEIMQIPNIQDALTQTKAKPELEEFITDNYLFIAKPEELTQVLTQNQMQERITQGLKTLQNKFLHDDIIEKGLIDTHTQSKQNYMQTRVFNPIDPLMLFNLSVPDSRILIADNYGYMALLEMKSISEKDVKETLQKFQNIQKKYPEIRYFSTNFMSVENLDLILNEVNFLLTFSALAFITIYFIIIRIPLLTINTICTLAIANLLAVLIVQAVYPHVTIMALSFGMGISNIAIDYMMHYNFFNLYAQRTKFFFNKPVFYGYITTIVGFGACLFIPFPLLAQLSLYAIIALTICYISFAFLYPLIGFGTPKFFPKLHTLCFQKLPSYWFLGIALCGFIIAGLNIKIDFDLSKLDYQNKPMLAERDFFLQSQENTTQMLLSSQTLDGLIMLAGSIQNILNNNKDTKTFIPLSLIPTYTQMQNNLQFLESTIFHKNKLALLQALPTIEANFLQSIQTSEDDNKDEQEEVIKELFTLFKESYTIPTQETFTLQKLEEMGFNILQEMHAQTEQTYFYYLVHIHNDDIPILTNIAKMLQNNENLQQETIIFDKEIFQKLLEYHCNIEPRTLQNIMDNLASTIYTPMFVILSLALSLMILMLLITTKKAFLDSVSFVLFPLASALCVISLHSTLNIMHLFALLILVVISVDYGIYSAKENNNPQTTHAIFFSVITTGISFGVLIFAQTKALNSFGEVIFTGMVCILLMLLLHRPIAIKNSIQHE